MMLPTGPLVDAKGHVTQAWAIFFQTLADANGGPAFLIVDERVDDTTIRQRMAGKDGVVRFSPNVTLT